jgi:hypothetical protein
MYALLFGRGNNIVDNVHYVFIIIVDGYFEIKQKLKIKKEL